MCDKAQQPHRQREPCVSHHTPGHVRHFGQTSPSSTCGHGNAEGKLNEAEAVANDGAEVSAVTIVNRVRQAAQIHGTDA